MMTRLLVAAGTAALLAGCTTGSAGSPQVPPTPADKIAPTVSNPKDARGVPPCTLLTAAQAVELQLDPSRARPGHSADIVDCGWPSTQPGISSIDVSVDTNPARRGLTNTYLGRDFFARFEPLVIDGYPAARADQVLSNDCTIFVGLSETQAMFVSTNVKQPTDSCALTRRAISAMLTNLPPQR